MQNYTVLHCHTMLSNGVTNIDSITTYKDYINKAKECGMNALAFSEHGSVFGWYNKKMEVEKAGMKYIHAQEFYITETLDEKVRDNFHCLLLARGYDGFIELNKLSSKAFNRQSNNFYYVPRISFEDLINTSDEIIISTGCLAGILNKGSEELQKRMLEFMLTNKHRCFLELQPHISEDQKAYNKKLYELSVEHGLEMVMCTDTHALNDEHVEGRLVLQKSKNIHFEGEDEFDLTFKTYEELIRACKLQAAIPMEAYYDAIENTNKIADMVEEFDIDYSYKYPHLWGDDSGKVFKRKIMEGIKRKGIDKYPNYNEYVERIRHEIESYVHNDAIDFMLLMEDIVNWCNKHDINIGYGRGSVNGSVIAWLLGITEMDSIKHGLNFERFMNVERQSLADIDSDIPPSKIEEVKQYLFNKHGLYCSDIITFNTIALKGAIRDVGRALEMPLKEVDEISKSVDNKEAQLREKYPELFKYVDMVEGTIISVGSHPCGTVVNAFPLDGPMGLMTTSTSKYPISQIYMKEIDAQNYVKLDLLKLDTIELINETCKLAGIERVTPDLLDVTDETVWNEMRDDTTQVFQWESDLAQSYVRKLLSDENIERFKEVNEDVDRMTLLTIGNSAIRPAGASYRDDLAKGVIRKTGYKCLDDFLKPTFGYLVFQCQIIEFLHEYCGFTMGEADVIRRCLDENTSISMANGTTKKIKDVKVGDEVISVDNGVVTYKKVTKVFNNGRSNVLKIKTKHEKEIIATPSHKVLTQRGWVRCQELTTDDYIMTPNRIHGKQDSLRSNQRLKSSDMFLIGMLIGDGTIKSKEGLKFTNSDMALIDKFKECVNARLRTNKDCCFVMSSCEGVTVNAVYNIGISVTESANYRNSVWNLLEKYSINQAAANKHIPEELMMYPIDDKLSNLLAGLFSTDGGYVYESNAIEYYTISKELANNVEYLLKRYGINCYVSKSFVSGYDYYCYRVRIVGRTALDIFRKKIVPFMVGNKRTEFTNIINGSLNNKYNYLVPKRYIEELEHSCNRFGISKRSIGIDNQLIYGSMTDIKMRKLIESVYCPETYKLLMSEYEPLKIITIEGAGESNVYDIEVEETHNYVANGLIVHNCFAKKLGTEDKIPIIKYGGKLNDAHHIPGFIETMKDKYGLTESESEAAITDFLQVIEDASNYLFSINHSQPYSYEGYAAAWLRHYYPLEFLTTALNINEGKQEKTNKIIEYANKVGIKIEGIKFRHSLAEYTFSKEYNSIYKGMSSIKYLNKKISRELYALRDNEYEDFIDLLIDIKKTSVNSRQLEILIKLDFFSEFGHIKKLLTQVKIFDMFDGRKTLKVEEANRMGLTPELIEKFGGQSTEKQIKNLDIKSLIKYICDNRTYPKTTITDRINYENETLGYIDIKMPELSADYGYVLNVNKKYNNKMIELYRLQDGTTESIKIKGKTYDLNPIEEGMIIRTLEASEELKWYKAPDGSWKRREDEYETILRRWKIVR